MTDYKELVEALRCELHYTSCPETNCKYICHDTFCDTYRLMLDAAAVIEALQAEHKKTVTQIFGEEQQEWEEYCTGLMNRIMELKAQLPKRGEWVDGDNFEDPFLGKFRCSVCGHAVQAIEYNYEQKTVRFASGKTEYCPNCGAKMEVQE